jgi:Kef-type K+ transport system membrane component KefB
MVTLLLQIVIVIALCQVCGWVFERIGQCRVVGEIIAGLLLGPSAFGAFSPIFYDRLFGTNAPQGMAQMGDIGLALIMFQVGLHLNTRQAYSLRQIAAPMVVAILGMCIPGAFGVAIAIVSKNALAPDVPTLPYVLFCGVALSVSAVPVMARIIEDLKLSGSISANLALTSAMINDVAGWMLLAVISSIAVTGGLDTTLLRMIFCLLAFLFGAALVAKIISRSFLSAYKRSEQSPISSLTIVISYALICGWVTSLLGLQSVLGAFAAGIFLRKTPGLVDLWEQQVGGFVRLVLMPIFFATAGLHASLGTLDGMTAWRWFVVFLFFGFIGKFGGSYIGVRIIGRSHTDAALVGTLMNTRGLMELILLSMGLQMYILPQRVYTILIMFALVTTAMTAPLIRSMFRERPEMVTMNTSG